MSKIIRFSGGIVFSLTLLGSSALPAQAAALTTDQINAIVALLQSFGADQSVVSNVQTSLGGTPATSSGPVILPQQPFAVGTAVLNFNRDLYVGMRGNDVSNLQEFLTEEGYYAGPVSGYFGLLTVQAVKKFQSAHGINPTGYFGPRTRAIANQIVQRLIGSICGEEGCPNDVLPVRKLTISTDSSLRAKVGKDFAAVFKITGGSR